VEFIQEHLINPVSDLLYSYILVYLLVGVGLYFTIRTRFIQLRYFRRMIGQLFHSRTHCDGVSPFQAFCVGLASRVGTGNIAGVAIALTVGGPGAIFWMWVVAAIGMATALIEAITLAAEARTAAVLDAGVTLPGGKATGTGTDCIAVAAPGGDTPFAGKHTAAGHALGRAVYEATLQAVTEWADEARHWGPAAPR